MTPEACPGCGAKLDPGATACPRCPMSFPEEEPSAGVHPLRQTRAYGFLLPALMFAAISAGVWGLAVGLLHLGQQGVLPIDPRPGEVAATPEAADEGTVSVVVEESVERPAPPEVWRMFGTVYDLTTLQPVPGCVLQFVDERGDGRLETSSDGSGGYRLEGPPLLDRAYRVSLSKPGYAKAYLNPGMAGVREMPASRRSKMAEELAALPTAAAYPVRAYDERPVRTDFYLAPKP